MATADLQHQRQLPNGPRTNGLRTGLNSPFALWAAFLLSVVIHGSLVGFLIYRDWLDASRFRPQTIEDKPVDYHAIGLHPRPTPKQESRNNPDGSKQESNNRPHARFNTSNATTAIQKEVPAKPPLTPQLPGQGIKTIGPGQPVANRLGGASKKFIAPNGIRNGATAASRSFGKGDATFFTIHDKGKRIIYVLDRSGSMIHNDALLVAKQQLIASLNRLSSKHLFQIIFYDESAYVLSVDSKRSKDLAYATSRNIEKVKLQVAAIRAKGGTRHMTALRPALRRRPDVIFFLTDADSGIDAREMNELRMMNKSKTRIHCIEFGKGPDLSGGDNFLKRLSAMTGGRYTYRDVQKFFRR